jgi:dTDP-D-glucose 4,6-dehydratase
VHLLVTGAAGFIGANFVHYWTAHHPADRVVALDALTYAGNPANLDEVRGRIRFVKADIGDPAAVELTTLALDNQPLLVYASSANRREWLHVTDHCAAIERVLVDGRDGTALVAAAARPGRDRRARVDPTGKHPMTRLGILTDAPAPSSRDDEPLGSDIDERPRPGPGGV